MKGAQRLWLRMIRSTFGGYLVSSCKSLYTYIFSHPLPRVLVFIEKQFKTDSYCPKIRCASPAWTHFLNGNRKIHDRVVSGNRYCGSRSSKRIFISEVWAPLSPHILKNIVDITNCLCCQNDGFSAVLGMRIFRTGTLRSILKPLHYSYAHNCLTLITEKYIRSFSICIKAWHSLLSSLFFLLQVVVAAHCLPRQNPLLILPSSSRITSHSLITLRIQLIPSIRRLSVNRRVTGWEFLIPTTPGRYHELCVRLRRMAKRPLLSLNHNFRKCWGNLEWEGCLNVLGY
jgi:hypothetical protein